MVVVLKASSGIETPAEAFFLPGLKSNHRVEPAGKQYSWITDQNSNQK